MKRIVKGNKKVDWVSCIRESFNNLDDKERALLDVLIKSRGYSRYELLKDDKFVFEDIKEDYGIFSEDERKEALEDYYQQLFDDMGLEAFSTRWVNDNIYNMVNQDFFDNSLSDYYNDYVYDLDEYELEELFEEYSVDNNEDLAECLIGNYADGIEWYREVFGDNEFYSMAKNEIDISKLIDLLMENDEYWMLAGYDNIEHEVYIGDEIYYVYRQN